MPSVPLLKDKKNLNRIKRLLYLKKEDFIVHEINKKGRRVDESFEELDFPHGKEKGFVKCILVKKGISTFQAVSEIASLIGIEKEKINYHGLKDTFGITTQEITIPTKEFVTSFNKLNKMNNRFFIKCAKFVNKPCRLREIKGNYFFITLRDTKKGDTLKLSKVKLKELPNFYGYQRFGTRQNMHLIGKYLLKKDYLSAVKYFCINSNNESKEIRIIRKELSENFENPEKCLKIINKNLQLYQEEKIFQFLSKNPKDYVSALNQTGLSLFCINSYSSYLFNAVLYNLIKKKIYPRSIPVIGYKTNFNGPETKREYLKILKKENIKISDFFNKDYKELSYEGRNKNAFYDVEKFSYKENGSSIALKFILPMGVYANLFLESIIENKSGNKKLE